jgi:hypothetical protein
MLSMRPQPGEYATAHAGYVSHVPDGRWLERLERQPTELRARLSGLSDEAAALPQAPGKWSWLDLLTHINDTERVFAFRLLWVSRGDPNGLPGFEQDIWAANVTDLRRSVSSLLDEFDAVRQSSLCLVRALPDTYADRRGVINGTSVTVRTLAWLIPGHVQHHLEKLAI